MTKIKVGVFGAAGRMGATVCQAVVADPDLELVAAVDPLHTGIDLHQLGVPSSLHVARSAEAEMIREALAETGGHRSRAAERLGISERTLRYRLAEMRAAAA